MEFPAPNLIDPDFRQLIQAARERIAKACPQWSDLSPGDPGMMLVELFAHMSELLAHKLNRLPERAYVEFLKLSGVKFRPPVAARVMLRFSAQAPCQNPVRIPSGTRVKMNRSAGESEPPTFVTLTDVTIKEGAQSAMAPAYHCEMIVAELAGCGEGHPGQKVQLRHCPLIAPTPESDDLLVAVETDSASGDSDHTILWGSKSYRIWREVEFFGESGRDPFAYIVDRVAGTIQFAPALQALSDKDANLNPDGLAAVPESGREIRVWYGKGGGSTIKIPAGTLTVSNDLPPGIDVTNPEAASPGRDAEALTDVLSRGPELAHVQSRIITARDYERTATALPGIARARAFTKARFWAHAKPGTTELLLVPEITDDVKTSPGVLSAEKLRSLQTTASMETLRAIVEARRPVGAHVEIGWVPFQEVAVHARVQTFRGTDVDAIRSAIIKRIDELISPVPSALQPRGWPFDEPLLAGRVYGEILKIRGVRNVASLRLNIAQAPNLEVTSAAADAFQEFTWYVVSNGELYRTMDDGRTWRRIDVWRACGGPDEAENSQLTLVRAHPSRAGWVVLAANTTDGDQVQSAVFVSQDCGETWTLDRSAGFQIHDLTLINRNAVTTLIASTARGLYEWSAGHGELRHIIMEGLPPSTGFWTAAAAVDIHGEPVYVAAAAKDFEGVWISYERGEPRTFLNIGLEDEDIRVLMFERDFTPMRLWAGATVVGNQPGRGCFLFTGPREPWQQFQRGWAASSCTGMAQAGSRILAASYDRGILTLDARRAEQARWEEPSVTCGLPRLSDEVHRFSPVRAIAVRDSGDGDVWLFGGRDGVFCSQDGGKTCQPSFETSMVDSVPLPRNTLFCSGPHVIEVIEGTD